MSVISNGNTYDTLGLRRFEDVENSTKKVENNGKESLESDDFIKLLVAQMGNQDPFNPNSSDEMFSNLAQLNSADSLGKLNTTMTSVGNDISSMMTHLSDIKQHLNENRVSTLVDYMGVKVLSPGGSAKTDDNGEIHGAVDLAQSTKLLTLEVSDDSGNIVDTIEMKNLESGLNGFTWKPQEKNIDYDSDKLYSFKAITQDTSDDVSTMLYKNVVGAYMDGQQGILQFTDKTETKIADADDIRI